MQDGFEKITLVILSISFTNQVAQGTIKFLERWNHMNLKVVGSEKVRRNQNTLW